MVPFLVILAVRNRRMSFLDEISLVIVNYNSQEVIGECLGRLEGVAETIIIDNASEPESVDYVRRTFPRATLIENSRNLGYGSAVNQGFAAAKTKYTLVVSPDTDLEIEQLKTLYDAAEIYDDAAIIAPSLVDPRTGPQTWVMGPGEFGHRRVDPGTAGPFCSWFVPGTVMLCPTQRFLDIGGFDENIFLYMEDLELAKRITEAGYSMIYVPEVKVCHLNSRSSPPSRRLHWRKEWNFAWGHCYVTEKFRGRSMARRAAWRYIRQKLPRSLFYLLALDLKRLIRDLAATHGAVSYLLNRKPLHRR